MMREMKKQKTNNIRVTQINEQNPLNKTSYIVLAKDALLMDCMLMFHDKGVTP